MNSLIWLFDKFVDIVAPRIIFGLRDAWRKRPIQTSVVLGASLMIMAISGSILNMSLYMPILFLEDDRPLRLYNYSRARDELKHINDQLITDAEIIAESSRNSSNNFDHSWIYASILVALGPALVNNNLKDYHG